MLLFIIVELIKENYTLCFNTSHVTLYQLPCKIGDAIYRSFNTSHVTLYRRFWYATATADIVSIHLMLLFIHYLFHLLHLFQRFNTSHVTLYHAHRTPARIPDRSFNTSHVTLYLKTVEKWANVEMFQYISCYSLSEEGHYCWAEKISFNTSHVTLYLNWELNKTPENGFNTSHVTLYRVCRRRRCTENEVSIHLMLLFISREKSKLYQKGSFNTSHVTLYPLCRTLNLIS